MQDAMLVVEQGAHDPARGFGGWMAGGDSALEQVDGAVLAEEGPLWVAGLGDAVGVSTSRSPGSRVSSPSLRSWLSMPKGVRVI